MSDLKRLINSRKFIRKLVSENFNKRHTFQALSAPEKFALKAKLNDHLQRLTDLNNLIQDFIWQEEDAESKIEEEFTTCESYFDRIRSCLSETEDFSTRQREEPSPNILKPPTAPLPCFTSKENEDFTKFISQFEEVVNKYNYSEYEKLLLLKQQISGRALILIESLESHNQGYSQAKSLLQKALASPDIQKFNTIKSLSELKLDNCDDPFEYVSKMKSIQENFKTLKISIDTILQYFFFSGLNSSFQKLLVSITNHTWPTLDEINDHFFTACERYTHKAKRKKESTLTNFAAKVSLKNGSVASNTAKFFPCCLCSTKSVKAKHSIRFCDKYLTPKSKFEQLQKINGCTRCGFTNHTTSNCTYRFKEHCSNCKGNHWKYLCNSGTDKDKGATKKTHVAQRKDKKDDNVGEKSETVEQTQNGVSITEVLKSSNEGDTILPTFSCQIKGMTVRGMKDSGCQSNFISTDIAEKFNLVVLDDVNITVNGINSQKNYKTKIVEVEISFGDNKQTLKAICMPSIDISLKLPKLRTVVDGFLKKGHTLADRLLLEATDQISDINLILGSKSSYCIPEREITFGEDEKSVYSVTNQGIMLKGDCSQLIKDLPHLRFNPSYPLRCLAAVVSNPVHSGHHMQYRNFCLVSNSSLKTIQAKTIDVFDCDGEVIEQRLTEAAREILESTCEKVINKDVNTYNEDTVEVNSKLVEFLYQKTSRTESGRLKMPILWNPRVSHLLGKNYILSKNILLNTLRKLRNQNDGSLDQINQVFKEQQEMGIIERIENLDKFIEENPAHSFLPFMAIFKPERETTKCRVVFLSNLSEKYTMSHNQCIHAGPSMNQKLSSSILHLRFGSKICCFDIKKAFNQIELYDTDQNRLAFLWFRNILKEDFSIVAYRNVRLPFGLRCSPTVLMLGMFKMLVLDSQDDPLPMKYLKSLIYQLSYMDNCAISAETSEELVWMYDNIKPIFSPYKFELQQFISNDICLQSRIDEEYNQETPLINKLLGLSWDKASDTLSTKPIELDVTADTKRKVLSTIASQFDLLNFNGPLMNRARIFMHQLQCQGNLDWDEKLSCTQLREWHNIAKQANSAPPIQIKRCFGSRQDAYKLLAYADSSRQIYGVVVYLLNLVTNECSFVLARNKIVNKQLESKTIPSLELLALALATETIVDLKEELAGPSCIHPINIENCEVFSDSLVALNWLNSYALKLDKLQRKHTFVLNRLENINKVCENNPIRFSFVSGESNPADCITRPLSYKQLMKTNYFNGPSLHEDFGNTKCAQDFMSFVIPGPAMKPADQDVQLLSSTSSSVDLGHLTSLGRASSFVGMGRILSLVLRYINKLKVKLKHRDPERFSHIATYNEGFNYFSEACAIIIRIDQKIHFPEVFSYFSLKHKTLKDLPNIVSQLNLYLDNRGLIRVKSKCENMKYIKKYSRYNFPLLISKSSELATLIIWDYHKRLSHGGCYSVLAEIRKQFWIPHIYSLVKKQIALCTSCKRMNARPVKLNQSPYRELRLDPVNIPFAHIYMDYMGPFTVKNQQNQNLKIWILCITCMWSRAINLKVCMDLTTEEFLRSFQLHCYEYGLPTHCTSDLGSQLVAGSNIITSFLSDHESVLYLQENNISPIKFEQYFKGCSQLGSLVESCVKLTKRLLYGSIKNNIIKLRDFEFIVCKTTHLVNRRPVAFKECLRDTTGDEVPQVVTPEMLIHGRSLASINVIPYLQSAPDPDPEWSNNIPSTFEKLQRVRQNLIKLYNEEFIGKLIYQAVNEKDRYKPVYHQKVSVGDIILLKEPHSKPHNYPLARVKEVLVNTNGEVTGVVAVKGKSGECVKRHASTIIPLLTADVESENEVTSEQDSDNDIVSPPVRCKRQAAIESLVKTRQILTEN